ncbi:MAG: adenosylcobinamide-phosphate synthase CbiB [Rhodobacterales bacterium]|nr:adenosylcobinamide-phosphate synthase CbiB [Rhodobacterales bacterium]
MTTLEILALALIIDALLGEPRWLYARLPHPAILMGQTVGCADRRFNRDHATAHQRQISGLVTMAALAVGALLVGGILSVLPGLVQALIVAMLLAQRSLVDHVLAVATALRLSTEDARLAVARIVSRDTSNMSPPSIARSAIESGAENFSDGVIAPAFWFLIAGLPGLLLYKITNTADSMIGYRTARHNDFGRAAARFDDLLNLLPARLSAFLIVFSHALRTGQWGNWHDIRAIRADAKLHKSPNAGWPESAMARVVNIALAGPRSYAGEMRDFPWVNPQGRKTIGAPEIEAVCAALWRAWMLALGIVISAAFLASLF